MCRIRRTIIAMSVLVVVSGLMWGCESAAVLRQQGMDAYRVKDYVTSRAKFEKVVKSNPADWKAQWYLGRIALARGNADEARMHLEVAYTLRGKGAPRNPQTSEIIDELVQAVLMQGDRARGISLCDEAIRDFGKPHDYLRKGDMLRKMGDPDAAVVAYLQAAKIAGPTDATPYQRLANLYEQAGAKRKAIDALRVANWIAPHNLKIQAQIHRLGEVPGPTFARPPAP